MVFRGKPSAGCENCRKAKKRCDLEQPACTRCVKLKKPCTGYRDTSTLQIQDESEAVRQKAQRQKGKHGSTAPGNHFLAAPVATRLTTDSPSVGMLTPMSMNSDSSGASDGTIDIDVEANDDVPIGQMLSNLREPAHGPGGVCTSLMFLTQSVRPKPDDIADQYFIAKFTHGGQWNSMIDITKHANIDPCLKHAIKACGMAALTNTELVPGGKAYARSNYGEALKLLNEALRDPERSRSDEALIAVTMLGCYENVMCESHQSIGSWKAHTAGAAQMLKLRGKAQLKTPIGRMLFREIRSQVIIASLWDDQAVPAFLQEHQCDLEAATKEEFHGLWKLADRLTALYFRLTNLRKEIFALAVPFQQSVKDAAELEQDLLQWSADAASESEYWQYYEIEVDESEHVWDGRLFAYAGNPAPSMWNQWRILRILLSRCQEALCRDHCTSAAALAEQQAYYRRIRRTVVDEICSTIPACLGHAYPAFSSSYVLLTAQAGVWALFFAATVVVERVGPDAKYILFGLSPPPDKPQTVAYAQLSWIMGRLRYISDVVGFRWADGVAGILRAESRMRRPQPLDLKHVTMADRANWLKAVC